MDIFNLTGKVAIVTGAARGLGEAMALALARAGASVAAADILDVSDTVSSIEDLGRPAKGVKADVSKKKDVEGIIAKTLDAFGRVDILVNNAGIFRTGPAESTDAALWQRVLDVNLTGQFICAQAAGREMIKQSSGKIINISSIAGKRAFAGAIAYNASKAALILMTKTLAVEWGRHNIQVNAICPGLFATPMTEDLIADKAFIDSVRSRIPLGREARPQELAGAVIFLASEASNYMTGQELVIDGGWIAGLD